MSATSSKSANTSQKLRKALMMGAMMPVVLFASESFAQVVPSGGQVVAGDANITTAGSDVTVDQSSAKAIITWNDFSIGEGGKVQFNNGAGATLNRVLGGNLSTIDGLLSATGSVYLINPNGVVVGKSGVINTGGTFVASALNLKDGNFLKGGDLNFDGDSLASVVNLGKIGSLGGNVTLIASTVRNDGTIEAAQGSAGLLAGHSILMRDTSVDDGKFVVVRGGSDTSVTNTGLIAATAAELRAEGGNVYALAGNTSGVIRADGVTTHDGKIFLTAGSGDVTVSGTTLSGEAISVTGKTIKVASDATLDTSGQTGGTVKVIADMTDGALTFAGTAKAEGGLVETSGAQVDFTGARVDTSSANGKTGNWLVDPYDLTVDAGAAATISSNLATTNVTLQTTNSGTSGPGVANASGSGDITVASDISWSSANTLTLDAYHSVNIKADITVGGAGGVAILTNDGGVGGDYSFSNGKSLSYTGSGGALTINGNAYTLLYSMSDIATMNNQSGRYALAKDVTSSGTVTGSVVGNFSGTLTGLGNVVSNLTINASGNYNGLFGNNSGTIRNIALTGNAVSGNGNYTGALVGWNTGAIKDASANGTVSGEGQYVGGLVGVNTGTIADVHTTGNVSGGLVVGGVLGYSGGSGALSGAYATGNVSGTYYVGGLVGDIDSGSVSQSFASGNVTSVTTTAFGSSYDYAGGLVGALKNGTIDNSYATGAVSGGDHVGGFAGFNQNGTVSNVYSTGTASGVAAKGLIGFSSGTIVNGYYDYQTSGFGAGTQADGSQGLSTAALQGSLPTGFSSSLWGTGAGYYPYLKQFTPTQKISGYAYQSNGSAASGATVGVYTSGALVNGATVISGSNGYYYYTTLSGAAGATTKLGAAVTLSGDTTISGVTYTDRPTVSAGDVIDLNVTSGQFNVATTQTTYSAARADIVSAFGAGNFTTISSNMPAGASLKIVAATAFTIDQNIARDGTLTVQANNGDLSLSSGVTVDSTATGDAVVLAANGSFINNSGASAVTAANGRWLIYSQANGNASGAPTADVTGGLNGKSYYGDAYTFATSTFASTINSGNRFVHGYRPTLTVAPGTGNVTYNGAAQTASVSTTGYLSGDSASGDLTGTVSGLTTSSKNAGAYSLTASGTLVSDMNYAINYGTGILTIDKAALTVGAGTDTKTYDGTAASTGAVGVSGLQGSDTVTGRTQAFDSKNAGTRTLSVTGYTVNDGNGGNNYTVTTQTAAGTIDKAALTIAAATDSKTYDGDATSTGVVGVSGLVGSDTVTAATQGFDSKNAGTRTLSVNSYTLNDGNSGGNYTVTTQTAAGTIAQAALTLTAAADSKTYDGSTASTGVVSASGLQTGDSLGSASQSFDSRNAGSRTLTVDAYTINDGNGGNNYAVTTQTTAGSINQAALTLTAATDTKTYDGTTASTGTVGVSGLIGADSVTGATQAFDLKDAGPRTLLVNGYTVNDGNGGNNYTVTTQTAAGTIDKAALTAALIGTTSKTYDATTTAALTSGNYSLSGVIGTDAVTLNNPTTGAYADKNAGSGKSVTASGLALSGTDAGNYTVNATASGNIGTISKAALTVAAATDSKTYDATTASTGTVSVSGLQGADTVTGRSQAFDSKNAGTRTLSVTGYTVNDGNSGGNYTVTTQTAAGTIAKAALTLTAGTDSKTYDATTTSTGTVGASGLQGSDSVTNRAQAFDSKNAGTRTLSVTGYTVNDGNAGGNYTVTTQTAAGTINKAALTIAAASDTKTYDGTTASSATGTVSGLQGTDTVSGATQSFDSKNAGTRTLSVGGYTVNDGNSGGNYTVTTQTASGTINKAALTAALTGTTTKTYDATTTAALTSANYSLTGVIGTDAVTLNNPTTGAYGDKNAGSAKGVTASGLALSGTDAGNYTVNASASANIGTISKAALTLTASTGTKTYDATTASTATATASGLKGTDTVTGLTEVYDSKNAGNRTLSVSGYTVNDGNNGGNYTVQTVTASGTINKAALTIAAVTGSKTYDGTTASTATATVSGLKGTDTVTGLTETYDAKDAGARTLSASGYTVNDGNAGGNYTVTATTATGTINKASLTATADNKTKLLGANDPALTYRLTGTLYGTDTLSGALARAGGETLGTYAITIGTLSATSNYTLSFTPGTFLITDVAMQGNVIPATPLQATLPLVPDMPAPAVEAPAPQATCTADVPCLPYPTNLTISSFIVFGH